MLPVFRYEADARLVLAGLDIEPADIAAIGQYDAAIEGAKAGDDFAQLALAVAVDAGDAEHLAGTQGKSDVVERAYTLVIARDQVTHLEHHPAERRLLAFQIHDDVAADHAARQFTRGRIRRVDLVGNLAVTHHA